MERKALVVTFNNVSDELREKLKKEYKVLHILTLPKKLKKQISEIPPDAEYFRDYVEPIIKYIRDNIKRGDILVLETENGPLFIKVGWCLSCILSLDEIYESIRYILKTQVNNQKNKRKEVQND